MVSPINKIRNTVQTYKELDGKDKKRFVSDSILNNALYILMFLFIVYTAISNPNFLTLSSVTTLISQAVSYTHLDVYKRQVPSYAPREGKRRHGLVCSGKPCYTGGENKA